MFDFIDIKLIDIIDIFLVALLVYYVYKLIRGTAAISIFSGIILIYIAWIVVNALKMSLMSAIINQVLSVGMIALIILFQQEIRRFLLHLGNRYITGGHAKLINRILGRKQETIALGALEELTQACRKMSDTKTGALIVIERSTRLGDEVRSGVVVDAEITTFLVKNIFFNKAPLHDGAVVIAEGRIAAAGCILPLSGKQNISKDLGTRHRAGLGQSENYDSLSVIVSEETGGISLAEGGILKQHLAPETLERLLIAKLMPEEEEQKPTLVDRVRRWIAK